MKRRSARTWVVFRWFAVLAVALALVAVTPGMAFGTVTPLEGPPTAGGVINTTATLAERGFEASEVFLEGNADSYHNVGPLTNTAPWVVAPDGAPQPYKTRMQIVKPLDGPLSGTVYVEWLHPTQDSTPVWNETYAEIRRQGAVYVGISASAGGVAFIKSADPARYGSLVHPGDSYGFDIFSQGGQALRDEADTIFGPGFEPEVLIALGQSATGSRVITYTNAFGDSGPYDAFYPSGTGATPAQPLRVAPQGLITVPSPTLMTNTLKPVMRLQSEAENMAARQPDSPILRWWEVPGTSHVTPPYSFAGDDGESPEGATQYFNFMINTFTTVPGLPACAFGMNAGPGPWVRHAALHHMDAWVRNGTLPPIAPRLATTDGLPPTGNPPPADNLQRDAHGNAIGGIRSPHLDVPIATLLGEVANPGPGFCSSFGATIPFSSEKLAELYKNHGQFVSQWRKSVKSTVDAGFMTSEDGKLVEAAAPHASIP